MLKSATISTRLLVGFGVLTLLVGLLAGFTIYSGNGIAGSFSEALRLRRDEVLDQRMQAKLFEARMDNWQALATGRAENWDRAAATFRDLDASLSAVAGGHGQAAADLRASVANYRDAAARLRSLQQAGKPLDAPEIQAGLADARSAAAAIDRVGGELAGEFEKTAEASAATAQADTSRTIAVAWGVGALSLLAGLALSFAIGRGIAQPMQTMIRVMDALAGGDLSARVPDLGQGGEIGEMARALRVFKDNAQQVAALRREQEQAATRAAAERKGALAEMAGRFEAGVMDVVRLVASSANSMQQTAQSMSASAAQARGQASSVAAAADQATANVQTVAAAAEELSSSIAEISRQVAEAAQISSAASDETRRTDSIVQGLSTAAGRIGEVVSLINDIASQTNLLALNATIEAARAGDAGKGFAVVAHEVKSLATQTAHATGEIGSQIAAVQEETRRAVAAIRGIGATIQHVQEISAAIAAAVEEQGAATREIARNVQQAAGGTHDVSVNIVGVTQAATATGAAADKVLDSATGLARNSDRLRSQVGEFLATVRAG